MHFSQLRLVSKLPIRAHLLSRQPTDTIAKRSFFDLVQEGNAVTHFNERRLAPISDLSYAQSDRYVARHPAVFHDAREALRHCQNGKSGIGPGSACPLLGEVMAVNRRWRPMDLDQPAIDEGALAIETNQYALQKKVMLAR